MKFFLPYLIVTAPTKFPELVVKKDLINDTIAVKAERETTLTSACTSILNTSPTPNMYTAVAKIAVSSADMSALLIFVQVICIFVKLTDNQDIIHQKGVGGNTHPRISVYVSSIEIERHLLQWLRLDEVAPGPSAMVAFRLLGKRFAVAVYAHCGSSVGCTVHSVPPKVYGNSNSHNQYSSVHHHKPSISHKEHPPSFR